MLKKIAFTSLGLMLLVGLAAFAGCRHHSHAHKAERIEAYLADELDLNAEQRDIVRQIHSDLHQKHQEMRMAKEQTFETVMNQLRQDQIDAQVLRQSIEDMQPHIKDMMVLFADGLAEFHASLNPEQRTKLVAKVEEFKKLHRTFAH